MTSRTSPARALVVVAAMAGCRVGPDYVKPRAGPPVGFKEAQGWKVAAPGDERPRGAWWKVFGDATLDQLEERIDVSNQNLALAEANLRAARAKVRVARAGWYPTLTVNAQVARTHASLNARGTGGLGGTGGVAGGTGGAGGVAGGATGTGTGGTVQRDFTSYSIPVELTWELDVWGRIRRLVEAGEAEAEATAADLASARLSAQAELAQDYFQLRYLDEDRRLLDAAAADYAGILQVTENRYAAGVASRADVLQARAQLERTRAQAIETGVQRAALEHAIAVLIGVPASSFALAPMPLSREAPAIPTGLPSEVLERRPDVAAAERRMAEANAQIGVATAAFYPRLTLSASAGIISTDLAALVGVNSLFWSVGPGLAATFFDGGARAAAVDQARAAYDAAVAAYRQTVLTAFQDVEDQLAAMRILAEETAAQERAVTAIEEAVQVTRNQYEAGTAGYLELLVAQTNALTDRRTAADLRARRVVAAVLLIKALGGGW